MHMAARRAPAFTVSAAARDNPLVREMYDDEDEDEDPQVCPPPPAACSRAACEPPCWS